MSFNEQVKEIFKGKNKHDAQARKQFAERMQFLLDEMVKFMDSHDVNCVELGELAKSMTANCVSNYNTVIAKKETQLNFLRDKYERNDNNQPKKDSSKEDKK